MLDAWEDEIALVALLKTCTNQKNLLKGSRIHADILRRGLLKNNVFVGNTLVSMYAKCGALTGAQEVFDSLPYRDVVSWTALITGNVEHRNGNGAFTLFYQMQYEGISPNQLTFNSVLKACGIIGAIDKGKELHAEIRRKGLLKTNTVLGNVLLDMYARCGILVKVQEVFDELIVPDIVSWTTLITGYAQHGYDAAALNWFDQMQRKGMPPDAVTFLCILKVCGNIGEADKGKEVHAEILRKGLLGKGNVLGNALVNMYAKCGALERAQEVFDGLPVRDVVSWTALISGYAKGELGEEALYCFQRMQLEGFSPNEVTLLCSLKACSSIGATGKGREIHGVIMRECLLAKHIVLGNALVDMYAKCGALTRAQHVFNELPMQDVVAWNALIAGYSQYGFAKEALACFKQMQHKGVSPDTVTFLSILSACSSAGLVEDGQKLFNAMCISHVILPSVEHYTCMVDLFSRGGHFNEAMSVIKKIPPSSCLPLWLTLLCSCRNWGAVKLGRLAFQHAIELDKNSSMAYVCMCNIYVAAGMQEEADNIETLRIRNGVMMAPGFFVWVDPG